MPTAPTYLVHTGSTSPRLPSSVRDGVRGERQGFSLQNRVWHLRERRNSPVSHGMVANHPRHQDTRKRGGGSRWACLTGASRSGVEGVRPGRVAHRPRVRGRRGQSAGTGRPHTVAGHPWQPPLAFIHTAPQERRSRPTASKPPPRENPTPAMPWKAPPHPSPRAVPTTPH
jgi:hypothetical protein